VQTMTSNSRSSIQRLLSAISASRAEAEFTDLTLSHEAGCFKVHRIIVCSQSKVLYKACTRGFKESSTGVIEMADMSYTELNKMVNFFYSMNYDDEIPEEETGYETGPPISLLQLHARMFALGDRYDIPGLRDMAVKKYSSRAAVPGMPLELLESIYDVYNGTPASVRQLRDAAGVLVRKNLPKMLDEAAVAAAYEKVLTEVPEFTKELLGIYVKAALFGECHTCGPNQGMEALQVRCMRCGKGKSSLSGLY